MLHLLLMLYILLLYYCISRVLFYNCLQNYVSFFERFIMFVKIKSAKRNLYKLFLSATLTTYVIYITTLLIHKYYFIL